MKLYHFYHRDEIHLGIGVADGVFDLTAAADPNLPKTLGEVMARPRFLLPAGGPILPLKSLRLAPAVPQPGKIICIGLNYRRHAAETGSPIPTEPIVFSKFENALAASGQDIPMPGRGVQVDYEAELVIVIGKTARSVPEETALEHVFGYTAGNDISIRDLQFATPQWLIGKTADGFAPVGPCIVTAGTVEPDNLSISCRVNGQLRQSSGTGDMIFSCARLVSHLSALMTLKPGDLIFTGTPEGVILGYPAEKQVWLKAGDEIVCEIEGIGALRNRLTEKQAGTGEAI